MDDIRFKNLYDAFLSHIDYSNYIESYGKDDVDLSKINYNLLIAIFSGFYLTTVVDNLIEKDELGVSKINIVPEFLDAVVEKIAKKTGTKWQLGEIKYDSSKDVLEKVRNKLAHGDFIVENGNIIFEEEEKTGLVKVDDLLSVIGAIDENIKLYKEYGESTTINASLKYVEKANVHGEPSFKKFCKDVIVMFVNDEPVKGKKRTLQYVDFLKKMKKGLYTIFKEDELTDKRIKEYIKVNEPLLNNLGIKLDVEIKTLYDLPYYETLKKSYFEGKEYSSYLNGPLLGEFLLNKVLKLNKGEFQSFNAAKGTYVNLALLKMLRDNPGMTLHDIPIKFKELTKVFLYDMDNAILAANLVGFNSFYQFGLEKGLTEKGSYDLAKIVKKESIDFSKFDLDLLDSPTMVIEHKFESYHDDLKKYQNKEKYLQASLESAYNALEGYKTHTTEENRNQEKLKELEKRYEETYNAYKENVILVKYMTDFYQVFDHNKYVRNINIIEHIRNAMAHGNIFLDEYNNQEDIINKKIIIKDYDKKGNLVYDKTITVYEFASLFKMHNFYQLYDFFSNNIKDKTLLDDTYIERLNERINKRIR